MKCGTEAGFHVSLETKKNYCPKKSLSCPKGIIGANAHKHAFIFDTSRFFKIFFSNCLSSVTQHVHYI